MATNAPPEVTDQTAAALLTEMARRIDYSGLPESLRDGVRMYLEYRVPMGSFLGAVARNNLMAAAMRADVDNARDLHRIACWFVANAPAGCWGSSENVEAWLERREDLLLDQRLARREQGR